MMKKKKGSFHPFIYMLREGRMDKITAEPVVLNERDIIALFCLVTSLGYTLPSPQKAKIAKGMIEALGRHSHDHRLITVILYALSKLSLLNKRLECTVADLPCETRNLLLEDEVFMNTLSPEWQKMLRSLGK